MLDHSVTPFRSPAMVQTPRDEAIQLLGRHLGITASFLAGEPFVPYAAWPHALRFTCESVATGAIARLDKDLRHQARLRCREQVALQLFQRDFSALSTHDQNRIVQMIQVITGTYDLTLEGQIEPLPKGHGRRAELEPEARVS